MTAPVTDRSFRFTHAIARRPGSGVAGGLRAIDTGTPDLSVMEAHHADYVAALRAAGALVTVLDPLDGHPDALFVEDTALCLREGCVILRPGAPSRLDEAAAMAPHLVAFYDRVARIESPARIEGGDILVTGREVLVGGSARTDAAGITALAGIIAPWGHALRVVVTPPGVLHFKTDCSVLDDDTILATERLAASGCFKDYRVILTEPGEEAAANAIRFNDVVLLAEGFPGTRDRLEAAGYTVREIGNSECAKLDGGMSCLSLRFSPGG